MREMGGIAAVVVLVGLAWATTVGPLVASSPEQASAADPSQSVQMAAGAARYEASCAACHGIGGVGTASGPSLIGVGAASVDFMLRTGRMPLPEPNAQMTPKRPAYDDPTIQSIVAYVSSLGDGPPIPGVQVTSATDIAAGRAAYVATCAACHGAGATGDAVGGGAVAPPLLGTAPTQIGEAIRTGPGAMPAFGPGQVSDEQMSEIAGYLAFVRDKAAPGGQPIGGVGPVAEGYVAWIVYLVGLLVAARWIERRTHR